MQEDLHFRVGVNPVEAPFVERQDLPAKHVDRKKGRFLGAEVVVELQNLHAVADRLDESPQILQPGLDESLVERTDVIRFRGKSDHPGGEIAGPQSVEQFVGRSQRGDDGEVRVLKQRLGLQAQVLAFLVAEQGQAQLFEIGMRGTRVLVETIEIETVLGHPAKGVSPRSSTKSPFGSVTGVNPPGTSTGVPSKSRQGFQFSLRIPKAISGR